MRIAYYFAAYRAPEGAVESLLSFTSNAPSQCEIYHIFRFRGMVDEEKITSLNRFYIYDSLEEVTEEEISQLEKLLPKTFSFIRQMHTVSFFRYPNVKTLPDDRYFAQLVKTWLKFYKENKIDLVLGGLMDDYTGFIGVEVARALKIPILMVFGGGRYSMAYVLTDYDFLPIFYKKLKPGELNEKYNEAVSAMHREGTMTNKTIANLADSYFNLANLSTSLSLISAFPRALNVFYFKNPKIDQKAWLSPFELVNRQLSYFINSKFSRFIFNKKPKTGEKFVFFPLHFSRDAALKAINPFLDQIKLVEDVVKVLPHDTVLYVKPHPHWKCSDISIHEMLRLSKIPKVRLLDYGCSSRELIRDSEYVIIINSSVGFEALLQGKKVVSLGSGYPPEVIPRLKGVDELLHIDSINMDWARCREFVANSYHHCIYHDNPEWFNIGRWTGSFERRLFAEVMAAYEYIAAKK